MYRSFVWEKKSKIWLCTSFISKIFDKYLDKEVTKKFIHISALGANKDSNSLYIRSKFQGEEAYNLSLDHGYEYETDTFRYSYSSHVELSIEAVPDAVSIGPPQKSLDPPWRYVWAATFNWPAWSKPPIQSAPE